MDKLPEGVSSDNQIEDGNCPLIERRRFLQHAFLAVVAASLPLPACKKISRQNQSADQIHENSSDSLPKVEYLPVKEIEVPELPKEIDLKDLDSIAVRFNNELKQKLSDPNISSLDMRGKIYDICVAILISINPLFSEFFNQRRSEFLSDRYNLLKYFNKFLLRQKSYLYVNFNDGQYNLFSVTDVHEVKINNKNAAKSVTLGSGIRGSDITQGGVNPEMPDVIHLWPLKFQSIYKQYDALPEKRDVGKFISECEKGIQYHEAVHVYLEDLFPTKGKATQIKARLNRAYEVKPGLDISLDGTYDVFELHELCAIGVQFARAQDPHQAILFISGDDPVYRLALKLLTLATIKYASANSEFKRKNIEDLDNQRSSVKLNDIRLFYLGENNPEVLNKAGRDMFEIGKRALEALFSR